MLMFHIETKRTAFFLSVTGAFKMCLTKFGTPAYIGSSVVENAVSTSCISYANKRQL
jgi:hypothetical protein